MIEDSDTPDTADGQPQVPPKRAPHRVWAGPHKWEGEAAPVPDDNGDFGRHRQHIEPWLSALMQADHVSLLLGSGLTTGLALAAGAPALDMRRASFDAACAEAVDAAAMDSAKRMMRGEPNIEDQIRAVSDLLAGLDVLHRAPTPPTDATTDKAFQDRVAELRRDWRSALDQQLTAFVRGVLQTERGILSALTDRTEGGLQRANELRRLVAGFFLAFASRAPSRERLHVFTTNYDRLVAFGSDLLGLRIVDRFVGSVAPIFRSSRLGIDLHYSPPGIRGEPRYLEGVIRLTKLHGSIDWQWSEGPSGSREVRRVPLPFGAPDDHPEVPATPGQSLMIYPNSAKDVETSEYPYAELFRDLAGAVCQPNAVLVAYGYGFGDDHVNRVIADMLTIPSTHLAIISFDDAGGRIPDFCERVGRPEQMTLLIGQHFGDLRTVVEHYLPKPAIDRNTYRMAELLRKRPEHLQPTHPDSHGPDQPESEVSP